MFEELTYKKRKNVMAKKSTKKEDKGLNLESILFNCRDYLRGNASLNDKRDLLLTLVFLRFIGEKFEEAQLKMRQECLNQGFEDENIITAFLNSPNRYKNIAFVPEAARWSMLISVPSTKLNGALDDALQAINDSGNALKGCVRLGLFSTINLDSNVIKKVVDEVNKISHKTFGEEKDLIGRVYEYFLKSFAVNATKEDGEFYTPHDIVELIAAFIEPFDGTLYDPCCGSGGMFVQCAKYVEAKQGDISMVNVYGQESDPATYRLAKMNLAVRGISHHLGEKNASTFTNDMHKGLTFDYIMANPPFNLKSWYDTNLSNDERWADYSLPPESNANYAWILHILSKLKAGKGVAGFLLANGALGDTDAQSIRQKLIENDKVEAINSNFYGISSLEEAQEYLKVEILKDRLFEICNCVLSHKGEDIVRIMGRIDALKLQSSMTLFDLVYPNSIFREILNEFYNGKVCRRTLKLLDLC